MGLIKWLDNTFTTIFDIVFGLLIFAAMAGGGFIAWHVFAIMEQSLLIQIGGTLLVSLISAATAWLIIQILKFTGG